MAETMKTEAVPAEKKGGNMLIIILAVLLAAGAAGGGVYFFTARPANAEGASDATKDGEEHPAGKKPLAPAVYIKLDPPFVANFEAKGSMRFLQVSVEIMTRDPGTADLVKLHDPMIRNNLLMLFGSQQYENISTREGKEKLRADALDLVAKAVTAEGGDAKNVEQLYFTTFVMQ